MIKKLLIVFMAILSATCVPLYTYSVDKPEVATVKDVAAIAERISSSFMKRLLVHYKSGSIRGERYIKLVNLTMAASLLAEQAQKDGSEYSYGKSKELLIYIEKELREAEKSWKEL